MESIEKTLSRTVDSIEYFFKENFYQVNFPHESINKAVAKTIKKDEGLYFEFAKMILTSQKDAHKLFDKDEELIEFADFYRKIYFNIRSSTNFTFSTGFSGHTKVSGFIKEFTTEDLVENRNGFYRAVVITEEEFLVARFFDCKHLLEVDGTVYGSGVFEIEVNEIKLHLYTYPDKITKKNYFIIETQRETQYEEFVSIIDEIILGITYLTGVFIGHDIYIVGSKEQSFEKQNKILSLKRFFDDLKSGYFAIPNLHLQHEVNFSVKLFGRFYFEKLISELNKSLIYKRAVLLICQAHTEPHYVKSTLYSVALETITNIIAQKIENKINPIPQKDLAKKVRVELKNTLANFKISLSDEAYQKIDNDIDRINSPTNRQKLLAPFNYYKIDLPIKDIEAIEKRNDFLHGRIPESKDIHYLPIINSRLLFCINCLILKLIDYNGYIMYHPVMYQINNKIKPEEYPIRKI